jgi:hypothetical protein
MESKAVIGKLSVFSQFQPLTLQLYNVVIMKFSQTLFIAISTLLLSPASADIIQSNDIQKAVEESLPETTLHELLQTMLMTPIQSSNLEVGKHNKRKQEETTIESDVTAYVLSGVDTDTLTGDEKQFLSDALLFSYNAVHGADSDFTGESVDFEFAGKDFPAEKLGKQNLRATSYAFYRYKVTYNCRACRSGDDMDFLADSGVAIKNYLDQSATHTAWEAAFCAELVDSPFVGYDNAKFCKIEIGVRASSSA